MSRKRKSVDGASVAKKAAAGSVASFSSIDCGEDKSLLDVLTVDVESLGTDATAFSNRFKQMAEALFTDFVLVVNGVEFRFAELEAYFTCDTHNDPFTHKDENQAQKGLFYFHRMKGGYKGGTYKGMDISIGNSKEQVGGMLVRSIVQVDTQEVTCGPCLCVDKILELCQAESISVLVEDKLKNDISVLGRDKIFHIRKSPASSPPGVLASPRVGLNMKKNVGPELQKSFVMRFYRFVSTPSAKSITKRKSTMAVAAYHCGIESISALMKVNPGKLSQWCLEFEDGKKENPDIYLNVVISDTQALRCMGALQAAGYPLE